MGVGARIAGLKGSPDEMAGGCLQKSRGGSTAAAAQLPFRALINTVLIIVIVPF